MFGSCLRLCHDIELGDGDKAKQLPFRVVSGVLGLGTDVPHEAASRLVSCPLCTPSGLGKKLSRGRTEWLRMAETLLLVTLFHGT